MCQMLKRNIAILLSMMIFVCVHSLYRTTALAEETEEYLPRTINSSDEDYIRSVVCAGDTLYVLYESGLYRIPYGKEERCLVVAAENLPEGIQALLADNGEVYCFAGQTNLICLVNRDGEPALETVMILEEKIPVWDNSIKLLDGQLYYAIRDYETGETVINICSSEEESHSIVVEGLESFDVMEDGNILAYTIESHWPSAIRTLYKISPDDEQDSEWAILDTDDNIYNLVYDKSSHIAYLFSRSNIIAVEENGEMDSVSSFPAGDVCSACVLPGGMAVVSDNFLAIRRTHGDIGGESIKLKVMEQYGRAEFYKSFYENWPDVEVQFVDSGEKSPEERYIQDMLIRDDSIDVYLLSDTNMLRTIRNKGFYADLSTSAEIREKVGRMYAPFRETFSNEGKIYAYPHDTFIESLCYHKMSFQELGVELPTTYEEYMDFCLAFWDKYSEQLPYVSMNPFESGLDLVKLLIRYTDELIRDGKPVQYQTEELERVLRKYLILKEETEEREDFSYDKINLFYSYDLGILDEFSDYDYLPLTFEKGAQALYAPLQNDFSFYVLNPYGKHVQEAEELILSYSNMAAFPADSTMPAVENPQYQQELDMKKERLEGLEYTLSHEDDEETQEKLQKLIEEQKQEIARYELEERWLISQEQLDRCGKLAEDVYICDFNPIPSAYDEDPEAFDQLTVDGIPAFLAKLDSRVSMILGENE